MPESNNIFLTTENLAFSLPLIFVCTAYAYFKYIPLEYGVPILLGIGGLYGLSFVFKKSRESKLVTLDERTIQDLLGEEEEDANDKENEKSIQKARNRVQARLKNERKAAAQQQKKGKKGKEDADDVDLSTLVGTANSKKKK